jgi:hypothetical protein
MDKHPGNFRSPGFNDSPEGRAGNSHFAGSMLLRKTLEVGQSQGFILVHGQNNGLLRENVARRTGRPEGVCRRYMGQSAESFGSGQV